MYLWYIYIKGDKKMDSFLSNIGNNDSARNLEFFQEMLLNVYSVHMWIYSSYMKLARTNCPQIVQGTIFEHSDSPRFMEEHFKNSDLPLILSGHLGLMWAASRATDLFGTGADKSYVVIGPVLNTAISDESISDAARQFNVDLSWRRGFISTIKSIPVVPSNLLFELTIMLHYCTTGKKIERSEIAMQVSAGTSESASQKEKAKNPLLDRSNTYRTERALLNNIRTGNLNYAADFEKAHQLSSGIRVSTKNPLQQALISTSSFTSLCVRAAIEGGLTPEAAYTLGDSYIQSIMSCKSITEAASLNHTMYDDFVHRVYRLRNTPSYSKQIQSCIEYIELHIGDDVPLDMLAKRIGYTPYYLSRKFKEETGTGIKDYIKNLRLEKAKTLLTTTNMTVADIADELKFCSPSYFSSEFKSEFGILPQKYREDNKSY